MIEDQGKHGAGGGGDAEESAMPVGLDRGLLGLGVRFGREVLLSFLLRELRRRRRAKAFGLDWTGEGGVWPRFRRRRRGYRFECLRLRCCGALIDTQRQWRFQRQAVLSRTLFEPFSRPTGDDRKSRTTPNLSPI